MTRLTIALAGLALFLFGSRWTVFWIVPVELVGLVLLVLVGLDFLTRVFLVARATRSEMREDRDTLRRSRQFARERVLRELTEEQDQARAEGEDGQEKLPGV